MNLLGIFFMEPYLLLALAAVPLFILLFLNMLRSIRMRLNLFGQNALISRITPENSLKKQYIKFIFIVLAYCCIVLELAKPRITYRREIRAPADMLILLDVSTSMQAQDVLPNRLKKAKKRIKQYIEQLPDVRVALIPFAGQSLLQVPLTSDKKTLLQFMDVVGPETIPVQGTEIAPALRRAINSFSSDPGRSKFLLLFTDGENHEPEALKAAEECYKNHIHLFVFGVGSLKGARIPLYQDGKFSAYKTNRSGKEVISKYNPVFLDSAARASHGSFFSLDEADLQDPLNKMSRMIEQARKSYREEIKEVEFPIFLSMSLFFLLGDFVLSEKKKSWITGILSRIKWDANKLPFWMITCFLLSASSLASAQISLKLARQGNQLYSQGKYAEAEGAYRKNLEPGKNAPALLFNLACTLYREEQYESAASYFAQVLKDSSATVLYPAAYYGMGNALLKQRKFEESIRMYLRCLHLSPHDADALYNLAYARYMLKKKPPPPPKGESLPPPLIQKQQQRQQKRPHKEPMRSNLNKSPDDKGTTTQSLPEDW